MVFLEMGKLDETKPLEKMSLAEKWLYFLKYVDDEQRQERIDEILNESEGIHMAMEILREVSADEQLRTRIRFQEKAENDRKARLYYAHLEGLEEGRQEGQHDKAIEIAVKALDMLDNEAIVQLTGLSLEEVAALRTAKSEK